MINETTTEITTAEIKLLWAKVKNKGNFIEALAEKLGRSPLTLDRHWFGRYWSIPKEYMQQVYDELKTETEPC